MKKLTFFLSVLLISSFSFAQKSKKKIPEIVKVTLKKKYPTVKDVKWDKENTNYEANFTVNKVDNSVLINEKGELLETEVNLNIQELPASVLVYISKNYKGEKVKEAAKIVNAKGEVIYEAEVGGKDLLFNAGGKYLKTVKD